MLECQIHPRGKADGYNDLVVAAVDGALGKGPMPMETAESLAALRAVFGGYAAASSGREQAVAQA